VGVPHSHEIDGHLHDDCLNCDLIRLHRNRDKAHTEIRNDLQRIWQLAQLRYHPEKKQKDQT
jgi:hypothetical protein